MDIDVEAIRNRLDLSLDDFAKLVGASPVTVWRWERGDRKPRGLYAKALKDLADKPKRIQRK